MKLASGVAVVVAAAACGSKEAPKCMEGASVACACPGGGSGAQICTAKGTLGLCACGSAATPANAADPCSEAVLNCDNFSTNGLSGRDLQAVAYAANNAKEFAKAICLASKSFGAADDVLKGMSHFEASRGWHGLHCDQRAVSEVRASLAARPHCRNGWKETCEWCGQLGVQCDQCNESCFSENTLIGKWHGSVVMTGHDPGDVDADGVHRHGKIITQPTEDETFEIARRNGKLFSTSKLGNGPAHPLVLSPGEHGELVDRSEEDAVVVTYSIVGEQLRVESLLKGRFGGTSVGTYQRAR